MSVQLQWCGAVAAAGGAEKAIVRPVHGIHGNECALWSDTVSDVRHKKHKRVAIMRSLNNRCALADSLSLSLSLARSRARCAHRRSLKHGLSERPAICVSCAPHKEAVAFYGRGISMDCLWRCCLVRPLLSSVPWSFPSSELLSFFSSRFSSFSIRSSSRPLRRRLFYFFFLDRFSFLRCVPLGALSFRTFLLLSLFRTLLPSPFSHLMAELIEFTCFLR